MPWQPTSIELGGRKFVCVRGSDVDRDGMYLELSDYPAGAVVLEIFYSDKTGAMTLSAYGESVPLEAVEWLVEKAKTDLPPVPGR